MLQMVEQPVVLSELTPGPLVVPMISQAGEEHP